jgi:integrase
MASLRQPRKKADGTFTHSVLYKYDGQQTSLTFPTLGEAVEFRDAVNTLGVERAMRAWNVTPTKKLASKKVDGPTLSEWLKKYIASRTGVTKGCIYDYNSYLKNDIAPTVGQVPLSVLSSDDIADWVQELADRDLAPKTIANRHGFLSAGLNTAVKAHIIPSNPAAGTRLPRGEKTEMCFLTHDEYDLLRQCFTERWRPLLDFMVASGARLGEYTALKPANVNRERGTVYIGKARKRTYDAAGYEIGATKTKRSNRTIVIEKSVLDALDYSREWLFTNTVGKPIEPSSFRNNVWYPALDKANERGLTKRPRIHDMRHCCASWMITGGASLLAVQRHLGHESISTTINLYSHLDTKDAEAAAAIIGRALRRSDT